MSKDKSKELGLEKLAGCLSKIKKPTMDSQKKDVIKRSVLNQLPGIHSRPDMAEEGGAYFSSVAAYIREVAENFSLGSASRAQIKERIFDFICNVPQGNHYVYRFFVFQKKFVSAMVLFLMMFGMFSFVSIDINVARAGELTFLDAYVGDVVVERNGRGILPKIGMEIKESDKISTHNGAAIVKFFDDSVSRLSSDTEVIITSLISEKNNLANSYVELSLVDGMIWSKVVNLVDNDSSFVVQANDVYTSAKKAAFNVEIDGDEVEVKVFNRSVDVFTSDSFGAVESGDKAVVVASDLKVKSIRDSEKNLAWVHDNLESDKKYLVEIDDRLLVAKMESLGVDDIKDVELENSFREDASLFLTFGDVNKQKKEFELSQKKILAAEVKLGDQFLTKGEKVEIENAIEDFKEEVISFYDLVEEVETTDAEYADELRQYAGDKLSAYKKDLSVVSPNSPAYMVKTVVNELSLLGIEDEDEVAEQKIDDALNELAGLDDEESILSDEATEVYEEKLEEAVELANSSSTLNESERAQVLQKTSKYKYILTGQEIENSSVTSETSTTAEVGVKEKYGVKVIDDVPLPPGL
jgi:FecR-like protein